MPATSYGIGGLKSSFPDLAVSTYQRALVWGGGQKADLIRSVLRDYPTGIIVLNRRNTPPSWAPPMSALPAVFASHDVVDGQQRLTTLFLFLENPLRYVAEWRLRSPRTGEPEPAEIQLLRQRYTDLWNVLKTPGSKYVPKGTKPKGRREKILQDASDELRLRQLSAAPRDPRFLPLVEAMEQSYAAVARRSVVIDELQNINTIDAERMYHVINTSGTELAWWELLRADRRFSEHKYISRAAYTTRYDAPLVDSSNKYLARGKLRIYPVPKDSVWDALFGLGEQIHYRFAIQDPRAQQYLVPADERRLSVSGLGFRIVSTFLSHDIGRVAINQIFDDYTDDDIRMAVDACMDATEVLFGPRGARPGYALFEKYSLFRNDSMPAYPLIGLIVAAAKLIALSTKSGKPIALSRNDSLNLRAMTEELFCQVICTSDWAGTGDAKLGEWLDSRFEPVKKIRGSTGGAPFPGALKSGATTYDKTKWTSYLANLKASGDDSVDRSSAALWFWIQYLFDSLHAGALPKGDVQFDHIVPIQLGPGSQTSDPLNFAAVARRLNRAKAKRTFAAWSPTGVDEIDYRIETLDSVPVSLKAGGPIGDFLKFAEHAHLKEMLDRRRQIVEFAVLDLVPHWISNGDP